MFEKLRDILPMYFGKLDDIAKSFLGVNSDTKQIVLLSVICVVIVIFFMTRK